MGDANKQIGYEITAENGQFVRAMEGAARVTQQATAAIQGQLGEVGKAFQGVQGIFVAFSALLAGGAAFKAGIEAFKAQTGEAMGLARTLGITSEEANVLNTALGNVFLDKDTYIAGMQAVTKALSKNGAAFDELGIKTKDSQGKLLPMQQIIANTVAVLDTYKAGVDRNVMANQLLGRSYDEVLQLAKLNEQAMQDAAEEVDQYHKQINPAAVTAYRQAMENMGDAVEGIQLAVGRGVMPIMTELGNWLQGAGPAATEMMIVAMDALRDVYDGVKGVAISLWETVRSVMGMVAGAFESTLGIKLPSVSETALNAVKVVRVAVIGFSNGVQTAFELVRASIEVLTSWWMRLANVAQAALRLDFAGAQAAWQAGAAQLEGILSASGDRIMAINAANRDKMAAALEPVVSVQGGAIKAPSGGNNGAHDLGTASKGKAARAPADKSRMSEWEAELSAQKASYELQNAEAGNFHQFTLSQELAFWEKKQAAAKAGTAEVAATQKKVSDLRLKALREDHATELQIDAINIESSKAAALAQVDADEQAAQLEVSLRTRTDLELLNMEQGFEDRRHEIRLRALQEKYLIAAQDPARNTVELARIAAEVEQLEIQHQARLAQIRGKITVAQDNPFTGMLKSIESGWGSLLAKMAQGQLTITGLMRGLFQNTFQVVTQTLGQLAAKWVAQRIGLSSLESMLMGKQVAEQATASGAVVATKAAEATMVVGANAAEGATGAAAAVAPIPIVGPGMAIAAFAGTMALLMGAMGSIKSASGGYDIPAGVNPMVQAHAEEMILPAKYANLIRGMADGGGDAGGGGGGSLAVSVTAMDSRDVVRSLARGGALSKAMAKAHRNFQKV
jgi:hypothetical protein